MEELEAALRIAGEESGRIHNEYMEKINQAVVEIINRQSEINSSSTFLRQDFVQCADELFNAVNSFCPVAKKFQEECMCYTGLLLGLNENERQDISAFQSRLREKLKSLEAEKDDIAKELHDFKKEEQQLKKQLTEVKKMRHLQKISEKESLQAKLSSTSEEFKRLRQEFEETLACEEASISLTLDAERSNAEKSHALCRKTFQSTENRFRKMETFRRKRLKALQRTLAQLMTSQPSSVTGNTQVTNCDTDRDAIRSENDSEASPGPSIDQKPQFELDKRSESAESCFSFEASLKDSVKMQ